INLLRSPSKRFVDKCFADAAVSAGDQNCLIYNIHTNLPMYRIWRGVIAWRLYMDDGPDGLISTGDEGKTLASPLEQELFHGRVLRQADRAVVSICGLTRAPYPLQKVSAHRPVGLIMRDSLQIHRVQNCEPRFRSVRFSNRRG